MPRLQQRSCFTPLEEPSAQIKLIHVRPRRNRRARIICTSEVVQIENLAVYKALSYAWGDLKSTLPIIVDRQVLRVTINLVHALQELRLKNRIITLWIDAIYINQRDDTEKSQQIQLMGEIIQTSATSRCLVGQE